MELIELHSEIFEKTDNQALLKVLEFLNNHDINQDVNGRYDIDATMYYNIMEYDGFEESERVWESHRLYHDVHMVLNGEEKLDFNFLSNMQVKNYDKNKDLCEITGDKLFSIILKPNQLLFLNPNDAHKTAMKVEDQVHIKKAIFKILIKE